MQDEGQASGLFALEGTDGSDLLTENTGQDLPFRLRGLAVAQRISDILCLSARLTRGPWAQAETQPCGRVTGRSGRPPAWE